MAKIENRYRRELKQRDIQLQTYIGRDYLTRKIISFGQRLRDFSSLKKYMP